MNYPVNNFYFSQELTPLQEQEFPLQGDDDLDKYNKEVTTQKVRKEMTPQWQQNPFR